MTHRDRSEYKSHSSVMVVCKSVTIPGMTGHVRRNTQVSPFYKKTIGYGLPDFAEELNYGVDLSTI